MTPRKTQRGRDALLAHSGGGLTLSERRVLILCDGVRSRDDLVGLLGTSALTALAKLQGEGYLSVEKRVVAAVRRPVAPDAPAPAAASESRPIRADAASRRSLAASKMYLLDMLQLQRDPESASLRAAIQTSPSEDELLYRMMKALRHLQAVASVSYAMRVAERLAEILPERYLPKLEQARAA